MALDSAAGKVYWTDAWTNKIRRANLDGSEDEDLADGLNSPCGVALDVAGGRMYWTDCSAGTIHRADLDGGHVEDLITTGLLTPRGLALA